MSRIIKFRAFVPGDCGIIRRGVHGVEYIYFADDDGVAEIGLDASPKMVRQEIMGDKCTLMQFTGLLDKNGVEIYEGDILDFDESEWGETFTPEIVPSIYDLMMGGGMCGQVEDVPRYRAVIGNIHENPELLEKG